MKKTASSTILDGLPSIEKKTFSIFLQNKKYTLSHMISAILLLFLHFGLWLAGGRAVVQSDTTMQKKNRALLEFNIILCRNATLADYWSCPANRQFPHLPLVRSKECVFSSNWECILGIDTWHSKNSNYVRFNFFIAQWRNIQAHATMGSC